MKFLRIKKKNHISIGESDSEEQNDPKRSFH